MRRLAVPVVVAAALLSPLSPVPPSFSPTALAAPAVAAAGGRYVALGDSYAAGLGIDPTDGADDGCGRSTRNYPHLLAAATGLDLVDVTCSGAVTADLTAAQNGRVAPQFDALTADTRLVTLTVGGNDLGFGDIAAACTSLSGPDGPVRGGDGSAADCETLYVDGDDDTLADRLTGTVAPALDAALAGIRERAPAAAVVVVDYPAIVPDADHTPAGGCWASPLRQSDALPFTAADLPYLATVQADLDRTLAAAAGDAGAGVATVYTESLAHTACGDDPWVRGVTLDGFALAAGSLHPNAEGAAAMAAAAQAVATPLLAGAAPSSPPPIAVGDDGTGVPGWVWGVAGIGVLLVALIGVGTFRVVRRRR